MRRNEREGKRRETRTDVHEVGGIERSGMLEGRGSSRELGGGFCAFCRIWVLLDLHEDGTKGDEVLGKATEEEGHERLEKWGKRN